MTEFENKTIVDIKQKGKWLSAKAKRNTKAYNLHRNMVSRVGKRKFYEDCSVSENFLDFQFFAEWCQSQKYYKASDCNLDKDLLIYGNKLYAEDRCVFIPKNLNVFLSSTKAIGTCVQGVCFKKENSKFAANIHHNGRYHHIGYFNTEQQAYLAYSSRKYEIVKEWRDKLAVLDVDNRVIDAMNNYYIPSFEDAVQEKQRRVAGASIAQDIANSPKTAAAMEKVYKIVEKKLDSQIGRVDGQG